MKLIIATHNSHKITEFSRILEPLGVQICTAELSEAEETGTTFAENAFLKAQLACKETGLPAVADDSGICVDALNGQPGIYSARYGGEELNDKGRVRRLLKEMESVPKDKRGAHFTSAICCVFPNGDRIDAEGKCFGEIGYEPQGDGGFGYDPIFIQDGVSFGCLEAAEKDARSHRGFALKDFAAQLNVYIASNCLEFE
jgi:non-canonical purine NTP pyrophosphatase, rdgB/HAM1 family